MAQSNLFDYFEEATTSTTENQGSGTGGIVARTSTFSKASERVREEFTQQMGAGSFQAFMPDYHPQFLLKPVDECSSSQLR